MASNTFIAVPSDVTDPSQLRRFLDVVIEKIDIAFGNRGNSGFTTNSEQDTISELNQSISSTPTQAEVQAISDKLDAVIVALKGARILSN